jgi:hypothetical protein
MVYKDLGISIGGFDFQSATRVSVQYPAQISAKRNLGENIKAADQFRFDFRRTPVYKIGDTNASSFLIDGIEAEMSISSTGLESLLAISGNKVVNDIVVDMQSTDGSIITPTFTTTDEFKINIPSGSRVSDQDFGVEGGGSVVANAKIQNVIL